jgi:hypothetical protein
MGKNKNQKKKHPTPPQEVKTQLPPGLKFLCIMSFLGFIYYLVQDSSQYLAYANFEELKSSANQEAFEIMETKITHLEKEGLDVSSNGLFKISRMFIYLSILDVLAMVGTALMYFKIRRGYYLYAFFQLAYVLLPVLLFGKNAVDIIDKSVLFIPLLYVGLFTTQVKHLNR